MQRKDSRKLSPSLAPHSPAGAAVTPPSQTSSAWILGPVRDSLLFIGAPLVAIATFLPMRAWFSSQEIAVVLLAIFTFGHHFPTFLRAYGDHELFARYRWRFLLAPPIIFAGALWFNARDLHGLLLFISMWDIWHLMMQHYGFMRIYDSKAGAISPVASWLDWALSYSWYVTLILISPHYSHNLLSRAYLTGLPLISPETLAAARTGMSTLTALLTLVYIGYHLNRWRQGRPVSWRKFTLLGIFIGATYFLYVYIDDFLVGFTIWSAFHCIQYYGIVWMFNRNRVAKHGHVTAFTRFLFRPRVALVVLYMAMIFAYGFINYWASAVPGQFQSLLIAFIITSGGMHYYYDGFIWKMRDVETRQDLEIAQTGPSVQPEPVMSGLKQFVRRLMPTEHGRLQGAYLVAVVLALAAFETWNAHDELTFRQSLVALTPESGEAQYNFGNTLWRAGRLDEAVATYRKAVYLMPESSKAFNNLGGALYDQGGIGEAIEQFERALAVYRAGEEKTGSRSSLPVQPRYLSNLVAHPDIVHTNLADALARNHRPEEALEHYRQAIDFNPASAQARAGLGATLADLRNYDEARRELEQALRIDPDYAVAHINLANLLAHLGAAGAALPHYRAALENGNAQVREAAAAAIAQLDSAP